MNIIKIGDVVDLNHQFANDASTHTTDSTPKIHLHDACGKQTCSIEIKVNDLDPDRPRNKDGEYDLTYAQRRVRDYFEQRGKQVEFDPTTGKIFWLKD
ncbi:RDAC family protein [Atopobium fossor]|uniref:RDAC family protein n=1 Tax=Atopobium fossor TaxID=39487 RepID=UPI000413CC25|nr:hypothetical protein [Atopobium fossor]